MFMARLRLAAEYGKAVGRQGGALDAKRGVKARAEGACSLPHGEGKAKKWINVTKIRTEEMKKS